MTSKCGKNKEVAHGQQSCVSLMFSPHFDVLSDLLLNRPTAVWNLFCFIQWRRKEKRPIHIPALYFLAVRGFVLVWHSPYLSSLLLFFCCLILVFSLFEEFFIIFSCAKPNDGKIILQNIESLEGMTHNGNWCRDFLHFRHSQVVKNSFCLYFTFFFFFVNSSY